MAPVVFQLRRGRHCAGCRRGPLPMHTVEAGVPVCLDCADLGHLVFLPRGDAALTRRARTRSSLFAVVVQPDRRHGRLERLGLLVEQAALAAAEAACLADAGARARRRARDAERRAAGDRRFTEALAAEIRQLYPGCPEERAAGIAAHASVRGSGRVGRTAAGRALDPGAVTAAVRASVRHLDTPYDALLAAGVARHRARARVADAVDAVLASWRTAPATRPPPGDRRPPSQAEAPRDAGRKRR